MEGQKARVRYLASGSHTATSIMGSPFLSDTFRECDVGQSKENIARLDMPSESHVESTNRRLKRLREPASLVLMKWPVWLCKGGRTKDAGDVSTNLTKSDCAKSYEPEYHETVTTCSRCPMKYLYCFRRFEARKNVACRDTGRGSGRRTTLNVSLKLDRFVYVQTEEGRKCRYQTCF